MSSLFNYKEDCEIEIPVLYDTGIRKLGDLWNCYESKSVEQNLFGNSKELDAECLKSLEIKSENYEIRRVRTSNDKLKILNIEKNLSLDFLLDTIRPVNEPWDFLSNSKTTETYFERLTCKYYLENYSVELHSKFQDAFDNHIKEKLFDNELKATHAVKRVVYGVDIQLDIQINVINKDKIKSLKDEIFTQITTNGPLSTNTIKILHRLDNYTTNNDIELKIQISSGLINLNQTPTSVQEAFSLIENIDQTTLNDECHNNFQQIKTRHSNGVPIRFLLVPISTLLNDYEIEKKNLNPKHKILNKLYQTLTTIKDFNSENFIMQQISRMTPNNATFIMQYLENNKNSNIRKEMVEYETKMLIEVTSRFYEEIKHKLCEYKSNKCDEDITLRLVSLIMERVNSEFSIVKIFEEINNFIKRCQTECCSQLELLGTQKNDLTSPSFMTNRDEIGQWLDNENDCKILLKTNGSNNQTVWILYNMNDDLDKFGIKVGFGLPSASDNYFDLILKTSLESISFRDREAIRFTNIMENLLGRGYSIETKFYTIYSNLNSMKFCINKENFNELSSLMWLLRDTFRIIISTNEQETKCILTEKDDKYKWTIYMPLDALDSNVNGIDRLKLITTIKNAKFVVGKMNMPRSFKTGPFLFLLVNGEIEAACCDYLDLLILIDLLKNSNDDESIQPDFSLLSLERINESFYSERILFAKCVQNKIKPNHDDNGDDVEFSLSEESLRAEQSNNEQALEAYDLLALILKGEFFPVFKYLFDLCCKYDEQLMEELQEEQQVEEIFKTKTSWNLFIEKLEEILKNKNPVYASIIISYDHIKDAIESNNNICDMTKIDSLIEQVLEQINESELRADLTMWMETDTQTKLNGILGLFEKYLNETYWPDDIFHLSYLIRLCKQRANFNVFTQNSSLHFKHFIMEYIDRIVLDQVFNQQFISILKKTIQDGHFYQTLHQLSKNSYDLFIVKLNRHFEKLVSLNEHDSDLMINLINDICTDQFKDELVYLWTNERFLYFFNKNSNDKTRESLAFQCNKFPFLLQLLPEDVLDELEKYFSCIEEHIIPDRFNNMNELKETLIQLDAKNLNDLPSKFLESLIESISQNDKMLNELEKSGAMTDWNHREKYFLKPWTLKNVKTVLVYLDQQKQNENKKDFNNKQQQQLGPFNILLNRKRNADSDHVLNDNQQIITTDYQEILIHSKYEKSMGTKIKKIIQNEFMQVTPILKLNKFKSNEMKHWAEKVLPYVVQKIKMWDCSALMPQNIFNLIISETNNSTNNSQSNLKMIGGNGPLFKRNNTISGNSSNEKNTLDKEKIPLSRLDLLTSSDIIVIQDLLKIMSKFSIALPLVIHDITKEDEFTCLLPLIIGCIMKWESKPGTIIEHELFGENSRFNLVTAVRLGNNSKGKSTILNQLFSTKNLFSSCCEPGAKYGKPLCLDGCIEFVCLTKESCCPEFWKSIQNNYYSADSTIILLANLHGDCLNYPKQLELLKQISSSFLIFLMPDIKDELETKWRSLTNIIGTGNSDYVMVDFSESGDESQDDDDNNVIWTQKLTEDRTMEKLRNILSKLIQLRNTHTIDFTNLNTSLNLVNKIETKESKSLIDFVKNRSFHKIRERLMIFQGGMNYEPSECVKYWNENNDLRELITLYGNVLVEPLDQLRYSLIHIDRELSRQFDFESKSIRNNVEENREYLRRILNLNTQEETKLKQLKAELSQNLAQIENMCLGLEHFYRELAKIYEFASSRTNDPLSDTLAELAKAYGDLLIDGQAIELVNGDSGEIQGPWLTAICKHVMNKYPNLRVFVVSIIGLQSSGKSTLLNALFGCKFAVSVGRCTRGLFLRLLFLNKELVDTYNIDALLIIDTEGLGAPEKMNDATAEQKDRLLASFIMGVSNMVIINVLGEYMNSLTEILQIAIVTMARLEEAQISPDILLVQHISERNKEKVQSGIEQFREALENAFNLASNNYMEIGIKNSKSLLKLMDRIKTGQLLKQFRPFKSGATVNSAPSEEYHEDVVNLYETILSSSLNSSVRFEQWQNCIKSYWDAVASEDFAVRFKNITQFYEFLYRGNQIAKVKESYEQSHRYHIENDIKKLLKIEAKNFSEQEQQQQQRNAGVGTNRETLLETISQKLKNIPKSCNIDEEGQQGASSAVCEKCQNALKEESKLYNLVSGKEWEVETRKTIHTFVDQLRQSNFTLITQMLDASIFKHGCSTEFIHLIDDLVKQKLNNNIGSSSSTTVEFTHEQQKAIVVEIWEKLKQKAAARSTIRPVEDLIQEDIYEQYSQCTSVYDRFIKYEHMSFEKLASKKAVKQSNGFLVFKYDKENRLDANHLLNLKSKFADLITYVFEKYGTDMFQKGMIAMVKTEIEKIINQFEQDNSLKLIENFKWNLHLYTLRIFTDKAVRKQKDWDKNNKPIEILKQKEEFYKNIIENRLKFKYDLEGEGKIIADLLANGICYYSAKAASEARINRILSQKCYANAQNIRLKYFSLLARCNNARIVVKHFMNPQESIEDWFNSEVDSEFQDIAKITFELRLQSEYSKVLNEIKDPKKDLNGIVSFVQKYLANDSECLTYTVPDSFKNNSSNDNAYVLRQSILNKLNDQTISAKRKKVVCEDPSSNSVVKSRLGCTSCCRLCGAICWGQRGHQYNYGETKKHHTSHQPFGLAGVSRHPTDVIFSRLCGENDPDDEWLRGNREVTWSELISRYHRDWKFTSHSIKEFDDLMCWFYSRYMKDLARAYDLCPDENLYRTGWTKLRINQILSTINSQLL